MTGPLNDNAPMKTLSNYSYVGNELMYEEQQVLRSNMPFKRVKNISYKEFFCSMILNIFVYLQM